LAYAAPGETLAFAGAGLFPDEAISYWLTDPDDVAWAGGSARADGEGRVSFGYTIPRDAAAGMWAMTAHGNDSGRQAVAMFETPTVTAAFGPVQLVASEVEVRPGAAVTFDGSGFLPNGGVSYWLSDPDGAAHAGGYAVADCDGRLSVAYAVDHRAQPGLWTMTAHGLESERQAFAAFEVVAPDVTLVVTLSATARE
jgi:hypothetical protein